MSWSDEDRRDTRLRIARGDQRGLFQRDRDRLLYTSAFQRLAGVTQIVRVGEADFFHTRQQHTIKVAQVGRRLAEHCRKEQPLLADAHGIDAEVVEAACLAHDLGHPPFGHVGEHALNDLCQRYGEKGGYEGNAQSFRIVTKLAVRFDEPGLDLTRATLAAILKYPWERDRADPKKAKKWSAYASESEDFIYARKFHTHDEQTAEAALMDWADDIAYSVHDMEDCQRGGLIPWRRVFDPRREGELVNRIAAKWFDKPSGAEGMLRDAIRNLAELFKELFPALIEEPYDGSREHRKQLRTLTSNLIGRYVRATKLADTISGPPLANDPQATAEVILLKRLARDYIISTPALVAQQHGQERVIAGLFRAIVRGARAQNGCPDFLPIRFRYLWDLADGSHGRFAADCVASLTERQTMAMYGRLYGTAAGSVLDPIVL